MVSNARKHAVSVSVPPDLLARLDREAAEQQRSRSNMLTLALLSFFADASRRGPGAAATEVHHV